MAPYARSSQYHQGGLNEEPHRPKRTQHGSVTGHVSRHSMYHSRIAQDVAYPYLHGTSTTPYPQQLEPDYSYASEDQYTAQSPSRYYSAVPPHGTSANPQSYQAPHAPSSNPNYNTPYTYPQEPHSPRTTAMYIEKRRPTQPKLEILDKLAQPTSTMARWENESPQTRPWNSVDFVVPKSTHEKRKK